MPTIYAPGADADEAYEALRGLAHASRNLEHPRDMYGVLGCMLALRAVLEQLPSAHANNRASAFDDRDAVVGSRRSADQQEAVNMPSLQIISPGFTVPG